MRRKIRIHPLLWLLLTPALLCAVSGYLQPGSWLPINQPDLITHQVYAYRQWQFTGIKLAVGDAFSIQASGEWSYSPFVGLNDPNGGLWAPDWYPLTGNKDNALGGALLGRIGDEGQPFFVGKRYRGVATVSGPLYLGINDDLLGDNEGVLTVQIKVTPAPTTQP